MAWRSVPLSTPQCGGCGPKVSAHPAGHCWADQPFKHPRGEYTWVRVKSFDYPSSSAAEAERAGGRWMLTRGGFVARWIESHAILTDGRWVGKPFKLLAWQTRLLMELFECGEDGRRRYRWALIGVPKKNGKTELMAAVGLFFLVADGEPAPFVVAAAASEDQADLVFGAAKTMSDANLNPALEFLTAQGQIIVNTVSPRARLRRVAAKAGTNDGKNIFVVICDELHEWMPGQGEDVWNVLTNGSGARDEPFVLQITTAGHDDETVCGRQYAHGVDVRDGVRTDDTFYFAWWEAPKDAWPPKPEEMPDGARPWPPPPEKLLSITRACNPSFGSVMSGGFYSDQVEKKTESVFRRYFWNQWTDVEAIWEAATLWDALGTNAASLLDDSKPLHVAIDIGLKHDSSAVVMSQVIDGRTLSVSKVWTNPHRPGTAAEKMWRLELAEVENYLVDLRARFPVAAAEDDVGSRIPGPAFCYDPFFFQRSAEDLRGQRLNMMEYPQTDLRMVPASQAFFEAIKTQRLVHDGSAAYRTHVRGVVAKETPRGWRISKPKSSRKRIDAAIAGAIACVEAEHGSLRDRPFRIW